MMITDAYTCECEYFYYLDKMTNVMTVTLYGCSFRNNKMQLGTHIGKYRIEGELGRGTSGICYRVSDGGVDYALKQIPLSSLKMDQRRAYNEVEILRRLHHPNIIRYLSSFADETHFYIVMQLGRGDMHSYLKRRAIRNDFYTEQQLWHCFTQLLSAVEYLHGQSIVHRDIKTLNVLRGDNEVLYLGDMGVSKIINENSVLYSRVGTPLYLAPEIIQNEQYDYKADIWGLGCVMYCMAALMHPFQASNIITLGYQIVHREHAPVKMYSGKLNSMFSDMLRKNCKERLSAKELMKKYMGDNYNVRNSIDGEIKMEKRGEERGKNEVGENYIGKKYKKEEEIEKECEEQLFFEKKDKIFENRDKETEMEETLALMKKSNETIKLKKYLQATNKNEKNKQVIKKNNAFDLIYSRRRIDDKQYIKIKNEVNEKIKEKNIVKTEEVENICLEEKNEIIFENEDSEKEKNKIFALRKLTSNFVSEKKMSSYGTFSEQEQFVYENLPKAHFPNYNDLNRFSESFSKERSRQRPKSGIVDRHKFNSKARILKRNDLKNTYDSFRTIPTQFMNKPEFVLL